MHWLEGQTVKGQGHTVTKTVIRAGFSLSGVVQKICGHFCALILWPVCPIASHKVVIINVQSRQ